MNQLHLHAIVLGAAIVLASGILLLRRSASSDDADLTTAPSPVVVPAGRAEPRPPRDPAEEVHRALTQARDAMKQAREILQLASRTDNNQAQMFEVHELIKSAQTLIEPLPEDDVEVSEVRRQLGALSLDAAKVSGL